MKIGLLSDTHGWLDPKIKEYFKDVDEVWHAGDIGNKEIVYQLEKFKPSRIVYGNIDGHNIRSLTKEYEYFNVGKINVLMTHIAGKPGRYYRRGKELIQKYKPQLFVCGHSHILLVKNDLTHKLLWMNPGACGYKGFHQIRTIIRFEIICDKIENLEVIELGDRTMLQIKN